MKFRVPFFGMLSERTPMNGLLEHYGQIEKGMGLIHESMECYITGGACREFYSLQQEVDDAEYHADKIKRNIRNHLPHGLFMPVDKTLFINYTRSQDNILDSGQEALNWLGMHRLAIEEDMQKLLLDYLYEVAKTIEMLKDALTATINLVQGTASTNRQETKNRYREIRAQQRNVFRMKQNLMAELYDLNRDFKEVYQLMKFVDCLFDMSHNAENCSDMLRAMIVR